MTKAAAKSTATRHWLTSVCLPASIVLVVVATVYFIFVTRPQIEPLQKPAKIWPVDALRIQHRNIQPELKLMGVIVAQRASEIRAFVGGVVTEVGENLKPGGEVVQGELLVAVDAFEYRASLQEHAAALQESLAREKFLVSQHRRLSELAQSKLVSRAMLEESAADLEQQRAIIEQYRQHIRRSRRDLKNSRLLAPFKGLIESPSAQLGKRLSVGDPIATLIDQASLEVRFSLSKTQFGRFLGDEQPLIGRQIQIDWLLGDELLSYQATIDRLGPKINSAVNGVDVYAVIDQQIPDSQLRSGALVQVRVPERRHASVFAIPEQALVGEDKIRVIKDARVLSKKVEIVGRSNAFLLVRGHETAPVEDGAVVVTTPSQEILDGAQVSVLRLARDDLDPGSLLVLQQAH